MSDSDAEQWERLVRHLDAWTSAAEIAAGRIRVSVPQDGGDRDVVIVMTPDEWDDIAGVMWGDFDAAVEDVKRTLLGLQPHEGYAVYEQYRLAPSTAEVLPARPDFTPEPGGTWAALDRDGRVSSTFADWVEPDDPA